MRKQKDGRAKQRRSLAEAPKRVGASGSATYRHKRSGAEAGNEDDLTRLIRMIARQAAREAFSIFRDALDGRTVEDLALPGRSNPEHAQEVPAGKQRAAPQPEERFLSVAEVAKRLGVSEKTVRRRIASGDLPAHRVGKPIRVSDRLLTASLTKTGHLRD
jgi:excisionase family DNA binding protein